MPMSSLEFKTLLNEFEKDIQQINDSLYQATKPKATASQRNDVIKNARSKLKAYDTLLGQLQGERRAQAVRDFGAFMEEMKQYLAQLERKPS